MWLLYSDSPPRKTCDPGSPASVGDAKRPTVFAELFPDISCTRRDRDVPATDGRPPLPPPRRPAGARTVADKASPPPPPAAAATASIEDVIGRLRLDDAKKTSTAVGDCSLRRVPRMGTRRCGSASEPPPSAEVPQHRPTDCTLDDDCLGLSSRLGVTPPVVSSMSPADVGGGRVEAADRRPCVTRSTQTDCNDELEKYRVCADVMYTNRANLRHTIAVQQRLFRQQLAQRQTCGGGGPPPPVDDTHDEPTRPAGSARLEWIVRKRSDGSRYVTRRPVRSRPETVGRSPAWVCDATTTTDDDDVADQGQIGRYWTRDERRQHVAERRQREAMRQVRRAAAAANRCSMGRPQHGLAAELAAVSRHRQTPLLSVATV